MESFLVVNLSVDGIFCFYVFIFICVHIGLYKVLNAFYKMDSTHFIKKITSNSTSYSPSSVALILKQ